MLSPTNLDAANVNGANGANGANGIAASVLASPPAETAAPAPMPVTVEAPAIPESAPSHDKEYELESASVALPDGDALIKHRFRQACELVDVVAGPGCTILAARFGTRAGHDLSKGDTVQSVLAAQPFTPEAGAYMILTVRNDDATIQNVTAKVRVRGEHGPEVLSTSPFAQPPPALSASGVTAATRSVASRSSDMAAPSRNVPAGSRAATPRDSGSAAKPEAAKTRKSPATNPNPRVKQKATPSATPNSPSKRRVAYAPREITAPAGKTFVVITSAQAEGLVHALESGMPMQGFQRTSLVASLDHDAGSTCAIFPGDVAVALLPEDLQALREVADSAHLFELPSVLHAIRIALGDEPAPPSPTAPDAAASEANPIEAPQDSLGHRPEKT